MSSRAPSHRIRRYYNHSAATMGKASAYAIVAAGGGLTPAEMGIWDAWVSECRRGQTRPRSTVVDEFRRLIETRERRKEFGL